MTKHRTLTEAYAANAPYCAINGHSWTGAQCSWCGAHRSPEESQGDVARAPRIAGPSLADHIDWILSKLEER